MDQRRDNTGFSSICQAIEKKTEFLSKLVAKSATKTRLNSSPLAISPVMLIEEDRTPRGATRSKTLEECVALGGVGESSGAREGGADQGAPAPSQVGDVHLVLEQMAQREVRVASQAGSGGGHGVELDPALALAPVARVGVVQGKVVHVVGLKTTTAAPFNSEAPSQVANAEASQEGEVEEPAVFPGGGLLALPLLGGEQGQRRTSGVEGGVAGLLGL